MRAYRPSDFAPKKKTRPENPDERVAVFAERHDNARDIWTDVGLTGEDARQWLRLFFGVEEDYCWAETVVGVDSVNGDDVIVVLSNNEKRLITRKRAA